MGNKEIMNYELFCGDCLKILRTMESNSVQCVITDPPYNVGLDYDSIDDRRVDYKDWCLQWLTELERICTGTIAISVGQANLSGWSTIKPPLWWLAWWKPAAMGRCVVGFNNWEPIAIYGKVDRQICDVVRATITPDKSIGWHPCPKPLDWAMKQIEMLTDPGDTILDPFLGSGTTCVAALEMKRKFIGIEKSANYLALATIRIEKSARAAAGLSKIIVGNPTDLSGLPMFAEVTA